MTTHHQLSLAKQGISSDLIIPLILLILLFPLLPVHEMDKKNPSDFSGGLFL